jgi:hypothetical protein
MSTTPHASNVTVLGNGTVNLNCSWENSSVLTMDVSGLNYTISNLNFMIGAVGVHGINFTIFSTSTTYLLVSECKFQATISLASDTKGIFFGNPNNLVVTKNCSFADLDYGIITLFLREPLSGSFPPTYHYNCSFSRTLTASIFSKLEPEWSLDVVLLLIL